MAQGDNKSCGLTPTKMYVPEGAQISEMLPPMPHMHLQVILAGNKAENIENRLLCAYPHNISARVASFTLYAQ
jgi:hypothetical protein